MWTECWWHDALTAACRTRVSESSGAGRQRRKTFSKWRHLLRWSRASWWDVWNILAMLLIMCSKRKNRGLCETDLKQMPVMVILFCIWSGINKNIVFTVIPTPQSVHHFSSSLLIGVWIRTVVFLPPCDRLSQTYSVFLLLSSSWLSFSSKIQRDCCESKSQVRASRSCCPSSEGKSVFINLGVVFPLTESSQHDADIYTGS